MKDAVKKQKIGIIGAGAMGCLHAAFFVKAGLDTYIYENDPAVVDSLREGIMVLSDKPETVSVRTSSDPAVIGECSTVFLFVKSHATDSAMKEAAHRIRNGAIVVSLQNGLGNVEKIREYVPAERIVFGTTSMGASKKDPRTLVPGGAGTIIIGGRNHSAVRTVFGILVHSSLNVTMTDDPETAIWKKAIVNAGINPLGAILGLPNGKLVEIPEILKLQELIVVEAVSAAAAHGIQAESDEMIGLTRDVCRKTSVNICSMLQDIRAGRKTEIESITGEILKAAANHGLPAPVNESVYLLVRALENRGAPD